MRRLSTSICVASAVSRWCSSSNNNNNKNVEGKEAQSNAKKEPEASAPTSTASKSTSEMLPSAAEDGLSPEEALNEQRLVDFEEAIRTKVFPAENHKEVKFVARPSSAHDVAKAYNIWATATHQPPAEHFMDGALQAYSTLGHFIDHAVKKCEKRIPSGGVVLPEPLSWYWSSFLKERGTPASQNASASALANATKYNVNHEDPKSEESIAMYGLKAPKLFSQKFAQDASMALHEHTLDRCNRKYNLHPSNPLRIAAKDDVVVEAEMTRFMFHVDVSKMEAAAKAEAEKEAATKTKEGLKPPGCAPEKTGSEATPSETMKSFEKEVQETITKVLQEEAAKEEREPKVRAPLGPEDLPPHRVHVECMFTVLVPPRRFLENYTFFYDRIVDCEDKAKRMSLAKALSLGGAYMLVKALDTFCNVFIGNNAEILYIPHMFKMIFPVENPLPIVRKTVSFSLQENGNWTIDDVRLEPEDLSYENDAVKL